MVKTAYAIVAAGVAIALVILGAAVYVYGSKPQQQPQQPQADAGPVTAFEALGIAENNSVVKGWKATRSDARVAELSGVCFDGGRSPHWTIAYYSGADGIEARVDEGKVSTSALGRREMAYPEQRIPAQMIDSDRACSIAAGEAINSSRNIGSQAIARLYLAPAGARWDVSLQAEGGTYVVRMDATTGEVLERAGF